MDVKARRNRLVDILRSRNIVSLKELANTLNVSEMTLYRDINQLSERVLLSKGNVIYKDSNDMEESPYYTRKLNHTALKTGIARDSIRYIENNDTIFLDGSSTIGFLANEMVNSDLSLTVVTISPIISIELCRADNIKILCPGGILDVINMIYYSDIDDFLATININKAFMSCGAFSIENGFTDITKSEFDMKKKITQKVPEINILVDHSKMNRSYSYTWCNMQDATRIIIDDNIDDMDLKKLKDNHAEVVLGKVRL